MRDVVNDFLGQLKGIWARLDGGQRLVVGAVLAATAVGLGGLVWYAGQPSYEAVFSARSREEVAQMQTALGQQGVTYVMADDGVTFMVERSQRGKANMAKNLAGLGTEPEPTVGGATSLMEDAETKAWRLDSASRALAESAIRKLDGVAQVTVSAFKPRRITAFRSSSAEQKATASVAIRLRPGAIWESVARAAASITASQLGIPMQNIEVHSANGVQRFRYDPDREAGGGSSEFLALQRQLGTEKAQLAQELLDRMWPGRASVAVTVELDPSWEVTSQRVVPTEPILASEKTDKDATESSTPRGEPGSTTTDAAGPRNNSKKETKDRTFVTDIGEKRSGKMAPEIKSLSVAVLYDRTLEQQQGFDKNELQKAVKAIVGWKSGRDADDAFSLMPGDFAPVAAAEELAAGPGFVDLALQWGPTIGQILGVVVVVMFLRGLFKRSAAALGGAGGGYAVGGGKAEVDEEKLTPEEQQRRMRREIERSIANDPAALAKLLESWLMEQKA